MILGIGVDSVFSDRTLKLSDAALAKIYSPSELEVYAGLANAHSSVRADFLASRFAVKEAYAKARGTGFCGIVVPNEISTLNFENGKPYVKLSGKTLENAGTEEILVSLSHEEKYSVAFVILQDREG